MKLFGAYLKQRRGVLGVFFLFALVFLGCFLLFRVPAGAAAYPALLCLVLGVTVLLWDFFRVRKKHLLLQTAAKRLDELLSALPEAESVVERDYQELLSLLWERQKRLETDMNVRYGDMVDYYTVWAHQIKTPIAAMSLHLQNEDSPLSRRMRAELFRVEQYVEMVMAFLRLNSDATDYVFGVCQLDEIIREAVKRFRGEFIDRRLRLVYEPLNTAVITDEKWLSFVVEQVLSNALKYTTQGEIAIYLEEPKTLCIRDTGIGVAPEDLPRIFDRGYTGYNGRQDKKASGIGLYLCRRICKNLGHSITAAPAPDKGTILRIHLEQEWLEVE